MKLDNLEPKALWQHFENICAIPHPSGHESAVAAYIIDFAKKYNLTYHTDNGGNVIIIKEASAGCENRPHVILQAHMDMVPLADASIEHDFTKDPLDLIIHDDGFLSANKTTLGADDGIGVCTMLAILQDESIKHGKITAIFTTEEETTMKGAIALDGKFLDGDYLINLDSEETYNIYVGCQGSVNIKLNFNFTNTEVEDCALLKLKSVGFTGGHSGAEIHKGRANAIVTLAEVLNSISENYDFFIQSYNAGRLNNAIASSCDIDILVPQEKVSETKDALNAAFLQYKAIYKDTDPHMSLEITSEKATSNKACSYSESLSLLSLILSLPLNVIRMSTIDSTITETSNNLGIIKTLDTSFELQLLARSLNDVSLDALISRIEGICNQFENVDVEISGRHGCWLSPDKNELIDKLKESFFKITGHDMKVTVMPAGLECGFFVPKAPAKLQLVSIGPLVIGAHTPKEKVCIKDVESIYKTVLHTLDTL